MAIVCCLRALQLTGHWLVHGQFWKHKGFCISYDRGLLYFANLWIQDGKWRLAIILLSLQSGALWNLDESKICRGLSHGVFTYTQYNRSTAEGLSQVIWFHQATFWRCVCVRMCIRAKCLNTTFTSPWSSSKAIVICGTHGSQGLSWGVPSFPVLNPSVDTPPRILQPHKSINPLSGLQKKNKKMAAFMLPAFI